MNLKTYFLYLFWTNVVSFTTLLISARNDSIKDHLLIGWIAMGVFSVLGTIVHLLNSLKPSKGQRSYFIQVIMMNMMLKFLIAGALSVWYYYTYEPENGMFIMPFIIVYVIFTIYEGYAMNEQAQAQ